MFRLCWQDRAGAVTKETIFSLYCVEGKRTLHGFCKRVVFYQRNMRFHCVFFFFFDRSNLVKQKFSCMSQKCLNACLNARSFTFVMQQIS